MRRSALLVVCLTVFVDLLGFTMILPSLPFFAAGLGATGLWFGALMTAYSLAQFVAAPVLGRLSDRYGRRPVLLVTLAGSAVSLALTGLADTLWWLLAARVLAGLFGGAIAVAQAYVGDAVPPERRTAAMAGLGAATGMAFIVGPAIGAALGSWGLSGSAYAAAGVAVVNLAFAAFLLPEPTRTAPPAQPGRESDRRVRLLAGAQFLAMAAFVGMETTLAFLGRATFGWDATQLGLVLAAAGLAMSLVQMGPVTALAARWGEAKVAALGAAVMLTAMVAIPFVPEVWCVVAVCVLAAGHGVMTPAATSLLAACGPAERQGARMGIGQAAQAAARAVGPAGAGVLFDVGTAVPYLAGAALAGLTAASVLAAGDADRVPT
ncbi:MFS transporter [Nonomuraea sp. NPDC050790]|uniref:MFS transporter n=1 Tax=Nonomuraea sp. NPDC050790 TaxID=3364371 RepID=UPI0037BDC5EC